MSEEKEILYKLSVTVSSSLGDQKYHYSDVKYWRTEEHGIFFSRKDGNFFVRYPHLVCFEMEEIKEE